MIFKVGSNNVLEKVVEQFKIKELDVEKLISTDTGELLQDDIFGEELLFLGRQIVLGSKRFDMIALDRLGRCVVIEIKKDGAYLSASMQALDYISTLRKFRGKHFLNLITKNESVKQAIENFVTDLDILNETSRIILIAREFQKSVFSLSRWLTEKGIAVKCISFSPIFLNSERLLTFSTVFVQSPVDEYAEFLFLEHSERKTAIYWHIVNDGTPNEEWWEFQIKNNFIALNYLNVKSEECPGYRKMNQYIEGDIVFVWAIGCGVIGVGRIKGPYEYRKHNCTTIEGYYHRRNVEWISTVNLKQAISSQEVKKIGLGNPRQAKQEIIMNRDNTGILINLLKDKNISRAS